MKKSPSESTSIYSYDGKNDAASKRKKYYQQLSLGLPTGKLLMQYSHHCSIGSTYQAVVGDTHFDIATFISEKFYSISQLCAYQRRMYYSMCKLWQLLNIQILMLEKQDLFQCSIALQMYGKYHLVYCNFLSKFSLSNQQNACCQLSVNNRYT